MYKHRTCESTYLFITDAAVSVYYAWVEHHETQLPIMLMGSMAYSACEVEGKESSLALKWSWL